MLERYPSNGRLLKIYGRFLEFVRNDPWSAAKFYQVRGMHASVLLRMRFAAGAQGPPVSCRLSQEALRQGTAESLLSLTAGQDGAGGMAAAGPINEKTDGLIIINAQVCGEGGARGALLSRQHC